MSKDTDKPDKKKPEVDPVWLKKRIDRANNAYAKKLMDDLGVDSIEEAKALMARRAAAPPAAADPAPDPEPDADPDPAPASPRRGRDNNEVRALRQKMAKLEKDLTAKGKKVDDNWSRYQTERRRRQELEQEMASNATERTLERAASKAGITRTDYALLNLRKHYAGLSKEDKAAFDETAYLEQIAKAEPWLCNTEVAPATTGAGNGAAPPVPDKPPPADPFDATTASKEDVAAREAKLLSGARVMPGPTIVPMDGGVT